jgi:methyl coenzyme M reductase beta subunit
MRPHELTQHAIGFVLGLALAAVAIDYGRQAPAPRSTAPVLNVQLTQD